jgi:heavy metal sensor kinase
MTLSIRARLTLWYSTIVVTILVTGALIGSLAQSRLAIERLDDDLARALATLEGVMRTEFAEGLTLEAAAAEASAEVIVPDRTLAVRDTDGRVMRLWGLPFAAAHLPPISAAETATMATPAGQVRYLSRTVDHGEQRYFAIVLAPLAPVIAQHREVVTAMSAGVGMALVAAVAGAWLIGRQTLKPLTRMAAQAGRIDERDPSVRLTAPPVADELGQLATSFNALLDRLSAALNDQRQFMANASHELRTPLSVVRAATEVALSRGDRPAEEYRESLEIIGEQANRLSDLVNAMFLLSRAEANGVPLRPEFLNLDDLLSETVRALKVLGTERNITVATDGDQEIGVTGDPTLLRQMIANLLDNAIRHAAPNGYVMATVVRSADCVRLSITNDGPPIAPADRDRIFDRFVRLGASNGAGLGLPIAKWIAEAHGGRLWLDESAPGRTTFVATVHPEPFPEHPSLA